MASSRSQSECMVWSLRIADRQSPIAHSPIAHSQELLAGVRVDDGVGTGVGCRRSDEGGESGGDHDDMRREVKANVAMSRIVMSQAF